ncbi:MAG: hypothetical protein MMC33_008371 [Icmadophila ericetorum]|nr:hypothetical protein [Icmadophila ericetorum]
MLSWCWPHNDQLRNYKLSNLDRPQVNFQFPDNRVILEYWDYHGNLEDVESRLRVEKKVNASKYQIFTVIYCSQHPEALPMATHNRFKRAETKRERMHEILIKHWWREDVQIHPQMAEALP